MDAYILGSSNTGVKQVDWTMCGPEKYVVVRWPWAILPCFVVLSSLIFLVSTNFESYGKQQVYKASVLAGYFYGREGWSADELGDIKVGLQHRETAKALTQKARFLKAKLMRNPEEEVTFIKVE